MFEIGLLFLDAFGIFWCVKPDAIYNISIQYKLHKHSEILSRSASPDWIPRTPPQEPPQAHVLFYVTLPESCQVKQKQVWVWCLVIS